MERTQNVNLLPRVVECVDCGEPFVISPGERQFYLEHCLKEPLRCFDCRQRRRQAKLQGKGGGNDNHR